MITAGRDGRVICWDVEPFQKRWAAADDYKIRSLSISSDDQTLLTGSGTVGKGFVQMRNTNEAPPIGSRLAEGETVWAVAAAPVSSAAACATSSGESTIRLFFKTKPGVVPSRPEEFGKPKPLEVLHQSRVVALAFSPNGKLLVTGSTDQTARFWNAETGQPVGAELKHGSAVWSATFSRDSRFLITGCGDGTIHVWDVDTGAPVGPIRRHQGAVWGLACDPNSDTFFSAGQDGQLCTWPLPVAMPELSSANRGVEALIGMEFDRKQSVHWLSADQWNKRKKQEGPLLDH